MKVNIIIFPLLKSRQHRVRAALVRSLLVRLRLSHPVQPLL
ncbi:hypothetical protein Gohar_003389 [Gossypium harknessii]|uniref:Uncharacterized protein n=1 Tax=Gossypium harknessii TaxID=34285 RepID=A0A7J9HQ10_9ROSI|nr:hypothetical protein [Gossypium harknessii]